MYVQVIEQVWGDIPAPYAGLVSWPRPDIVVVATAAALTDAERTRTRALLLGEVWTPDGRPRDPAGGGDVLHPLPAA